MRWTPPRESAMRLLSWLRTLVLELRDRLTARSLSRDLQRDAESFAAMIADEKIARGVPPDRARREARLEGGDIEPAREEIRDQEATAVFRPLIQDARYAFRLIARAPALSTAIVLA